MCGMGGGMEGGKKRGDHRKDNILIDRLLWGCAWLAVAKAKNSTGNQMAGNEQSIYRIKTSLSY